MTKLLALLILATIGAHGFARTVEPLEAPSTPWDTALSITPKAKYVNASIFGEGPVPAYRGFAYGADIEYMIGTPAFSMGPFFELVTTKLENTANTSAQSEDLDGTFATAGAKIQSHITFLKMGYSQLRLKDRTRGSVNNSKGLRSDGLELGAGLIYQFSELFGASLGLDLAYYKISPSNNSISSRLDYTSYGIVLGFKFSIPSGSGK